MYQPKLSDYTMEELLAMKARAEQRNKSWLPFKWTEIIAEIKQREV